MRDIISEKSKNTPRSIIRQFVGMSYAYDNVISFGFGQPDFVTPLHISEAVKASIDRGETFYAPNTGIKPLREALSSKYHDRGLDYGIDEIVVGIGGTSLLHLTIEAMCDIGDEVIISNPCYPAYYGMIMMAGAVPVPVEVKEEDGFMFDPEAIKAAITPKTKAILINYPSNPTGGVATPENLEAIANICKEYDIFCITDEMYRELFYTGEPYVSIASFPDMKERTVIVDGFSKTYAMTGYRVGYAAGPKEFIAKMVMLLENVFSSVPEPMQWGAYAALTESQQCVQDMLALYRRRRDLLVEGINSIDGISCKPPKGAFYIFANIKEVSNDSFSFCEGLLRQEQMLIVPGVGFGTCGEGFVRFSYATNEENIKKGVEKLAKYMKQFK